LLIPARISSSRQEKIVLIGHFADHHLFFRRLWVVFVWDRIGRKKVINRYESSNVMMKTSSFFSRATEQSHFSFSNTTAEEAKERSKWKSAMGFYWIQKIDLKSPVGLLLRRRESKYEFDQLFGK